MDEKSNDRIRVMEIVNRAQYNDEVIDQVDMSDLDLSFSDLSEVMARRIMAKRVVLRASSLMRAAFHDCDFELADFRSCNLEEINMADCRFGEADFSKANMKYAKINISIIYSHDIPEIFAVSEEDYVKQWNKLLDCIQELWKVFTGSENQEPWTNFTLIFNHKETFTIQFNYD